MSLIRPDATEGARDFSPGYLDTPESDTLPRGATPAAKNAWFETVEVSATRKRATLAKIPGSRLVNPAPMAFNESVTALYAFIRAGAPRALLAVCDGQWRTWDEIETFTSISGATGYTGPSPRAITFDHEAIFHDGVMQQIYDGLAVRSIGFNGPTAVQDMTAATGPGVTGTYEARYTWWNQDAGNGRGHESNPSPTTESLALTDQQRVHTRPGGAPPGATHWRIYVRRVDTNEVLFKFTAEVAAATITHTEAIIDTARTDPLPGEVENSPPSVEFALMAVWKGHAIGIPPESNDAYVSKLNDAESWHPNDIFRVGPGDGEPVRAAKNFGTELLLQKPHRTYHFIGDELPFGVEELHSAWGCVSQEAGLEVDRRYFAWDEVHGPYWTDLSNWVPLADTTIARFLSTVNRQALSGIRAVHDEIHNLVIWAVPTAANTRKRTLLAYHYLLEAWLPPITGLEYASLASYQTSAGALGVYAGDEWGRVHELFTGTRQSVPEGTVKGTIGSAGPTGFGVGGAEFYTDGGAGGGLAGLPVAVRAPDGQWQWRRILSATETFISIDTVNDAPFSPVPQPGWEFIVGGIEWFWRTPRLDFRDPATDKRLGWLIVQQQPVTQAHVLEVRAQFGDSRDRDLTYATEATGALWGEAIWGVDRWGGRSGRPIQKTRVTRVAATVQFQFENFYPDEPVIITSYQLGADILPRRIVRGTRGAA